MEGFHPRKTLTHKPLLWFFKPGTGGPSRSNTPWPLKFALSWATSLMVPGALAFLKTQRNVVQPMKAKVSFRIERKNRKRSNSVNKRTKMTKNRARPEGKKGGEKSSKLVPMKEETT